MARGARTDPEAWIDAAYARFSQEGLAGVRVEAVARDLGATKGSFYWHFADRRALVDAVMQRWEAEETERYIAASDPASEPHERIERLFAAVARRRSRGEDRLYTEAAAEGVTEVVERVARRRIRYIADALEEAGIDPAEAERRALVSLATTLGLVQLARGGAASVFLDLEGVRISLQGYLFS